MTPGATPVPSPQTSPQKKKPGFWGRIFGSGAKDKETPPKPPRQQ